MPAILLLSFIIVPLAELAVIQRASDAIGLLPTIMLLLVDSIIGAILVRREGRRAWAAFRTALSEGRWPGDEVTQGALVLVGGTLLLTPGFLTDIVGLLLVAPPTRAMVSRVVRRRFQPAPMQAFFSIRNARNAGRTAGSDPGQGPSGPSGPAAGSGAPPEVLEVEVVSIERDDEPTSREGD